jgi:hypothetical protein
MDDGRKSLIGGREGGVLRWEIIIYTNYVNVSFEIGWDEFRNVYSTGAR